MKQCALQIFETSYQTHIMHYCCNHSLHIINIYIYIILYIKAEAFPAIKVVLPCRKKGHLKFCHVQVKKRKIMLFGNAIAPFKTSHYKRKPNRL